MQILSQGLNFHLPALSGHCLLSIHSDSSPQHLISRQSLLLNRPRAQEGHLLTESGQLLCFLWFTSSMLLWQTLAKGSLGLALRGMQGCTDGQDGATNKPLEKPGTHRRENLNAQHTYEKRASLIRHGGRQRKQNFVFF